MAGELLKSRSSAFTTFLKKNIAIVSGLVVLCVVLSFASPYFLTKHNITTLLRQILHQCHPHPGHDDVHHDRRHRPVPGLGCGPIRYGHRCAHHPGGLPVFPWPF